MKTLKIINTFNFNSDKFIKLITSEDYYIFLKDNDEQLLDFNFEYFNINENEIDYKVNLKYKSIIPDYVAKFISLDLYENVTEIINYDIKKKICKTKIISKSLDKLSTSIEYEYKLKDNNKSCDQEIIYSFSSSIPFISTYIESTIEERLKRKSKFLYNLQVKYFNEKYKN
jgi:hypothetical protein